MIKDKTLNTIKKYNMLRKEDLVLLGCSGGPDSLALLHILCGLRKELGITLHIAHLNHMIRKEEALRDEKFVMRIAHKLKVPVIVGREDVPRLARLSKMSTEEAARKARYDFLLMTASAIGASKIAVAHNLDDQVETTLMRFIRGAGVEGLAGIPPVRGIEGLLIIRPLIEVWRDEIERYLRRKKLRARTDSTNRDTKYLRNRIRLKLIPLLKKSYNTGVKNTLRKIGENMRDLKGFMEKDILRAYSESVKKEGMDVTLNLRRFLKCHIAVQKEVIRLCIKEAGGEMRKIRYDHWQDLDRLIREPKQKGRICLPSKLWASKESGKIIFHRPVRFPDEMSLLVGVELNIPGETKLPLLRVRIDARVSCKRPVRLRSKGRSAEYFDLERLKLPLIVRNRQEGDLIRPFGMRGTKKIQDLFVDQKIPRLKRDHIPIVSSGKEIVWVPGVKRGSGAAITDSTRKVLRLRAHKL
ncbi:MAG: tRNA lysidine(34) synthetase TilS [Candidatus Omnitrophica bacterium]|nr:tRNA lysidine(34) synthetase TilS [Candidatus Omnitrophota bacterium]